jgi:hypothetical protein
LLDLPGGDGSSAAAAWVVTEVGSERGVVLALPEGCEMSSGLGFGHLAGFDCRVQFRTGVALADGVDDGVELLGIVASSAQFGCFVRGYPTGFDHAVELVE